MAQQNLETSVHQGLRQPLTTRMNREKFLSHLTNLKCFTLLNNK